MDGDWTDLCVSCGDVMRKLGFDGTLWMGWSLGT